MAQFATPGPGVRRAGGAERGPRRLAGAGRGTSGCPAVSVESARRTPRTEACLEQPAQPGRIGAGTARSPGRVRRRRAGPCCSAAPRRRGEERRAFRPRRLSVLGTCPGTQAVTTALPRTGRPRGLALTGERRHEEDPFDVELTRSQTCQSAAGTGYDARRKRTCSPDCSTSRGLKDLSTRAHAARLNSPLRRTGVRKVPLASDTIELPPPRQADLHMAGATPRQDGDRLSRVRTR